ncbi:MAG TPA: type I glutamate--ammonia ligase [Polyangiaceae bacterium]|jgi:glutamine synthetase|nr:type I glutamate--ammonia ligase [Polyangiaceae bacterium]
MDPKQAIELGKKHEAVMVDLKFIDLIGKWQHTSVPFHRLTSEAFEEGFGFDGSSIRGFQPINQSDMLLIPDPSTAVLDPFTRHPTLSLLCTIQDTLTRQSYSRDPRYIAKKAEAYLQSTGIADTCYFGPEAEFFIFDDVRFDLNGHEAFYSVDSGEAIWNSGRDEGPNLGHKIRNKEGYFPVPPQDTQQDLRTEIVLELERLGIEVEVSHHEVATAGQGEIDMRFDSLLKSADQLLWFKHVVKNVAYRNGRTATFMPKPLFGDNGNGMHCHQSLWKDGKPLFAGDGYAGLSELALYYVGGILKHAHALAALTNPTTNSYKRLVPGYEAPVNLAYSSRNRSAAIRISTYSPSPKSRRLELRFPDPTCNPYLAFSAMMMAGLDGIQNKIDPGAPLDKDIYSLSAEELRDVECMPASLEESLDALENDHEFLLKGDVFTQDLIDMWLEHKREHDVQASRLRPTPFEYFLYYDI